MPWTIWCLLWFYHRATGMRTLRAFGAALAVHLALAVASLAERPYSAAEVWDFDSLNPARAPETASEIAAQEVYTTMVHMLDCWNAHDLEGYLAVFWHSPALLWVEDGMVLNGWQALHDRFVRGFNNPEVMGRAALIRAQVRVLDDNSAVILEQWTVTFPQSRHVVTGVDTCNLERVDGVWKVTLSHSSSFDM
ncbi:MAG: DUF4440 domain-containing protein [Verrucomicrobia bacterium]|nr:DUF4440 domain-containing protein [Verrucomicrobiota bacterium]